MRRWEQKPIIKKLFHFVLFFTFDATYKLLLWGDKSCAEDINIQKTIFIKFINLTYNFSLQLIWKKKEK